MCRVKSSSYDKLVIPRCEGDRPAEWACRAANPSSKGGERHIHDDIAGGEEAAQRPHDIVESGPTLWCVKCGAYAEDKAVKFTGECNGRPKRESGKRRWGGAWCHLNKLLNGKHPRTKEELPRPSAIMARGGRRT